MLESVKLITTKPGANPRSSLTALSSKLQLKSLVQTKLETQN